MGDVKVTKRHFVAVTNIATVMVAATTTSTEF